MKQNNFFYNFQKARVAILQSILTNKPVVSAASLADLDLEAVAAKTEGYVAKDLNMMVDRTIHAHHMLNEPTDTGIKHIVHRATIYLVTFLFCIRAMVNIENNVQSFTNFII